MRARLLLERDVEDLVDLIRAGMAERYPHLGFDEEVCRWTIASALYRASPTVFVVEGQLGIVGYLSANIRGYAAATGIYTEQGSIFVHPGSRGTRAAALLIDAYKGWAMQIGAREAFVGPIEGDRIVRLYERLGFSPRGTYLRWECGA
jgi:GNAT superfamily N-acetyltransferase